MRSFVCLLVVLSLISGRSASCFAQQPGPTTLQGLLNSRDAQIPAAAAEADAGPKRPAGTLTRPKDGVEHPDLDKAWIVYDAAVTKVAQGIRAAINKQFDAATEKGSLDAAEKWQIALEKFDKAGELPNETETKTAVASAIADYKKAKDELSGAYEAVVRNLTKDKKIPEAKDVRNEMQAVCGVAKPLPKRPEPAQHNGPRPVRRHDGRYKIFRLVATKSNANGWEAYYRTIEFYDAKTGKLLVGGNATGTGTGAADAFDGDRATMYRTVMNPGVEGDRIDYELPEPAAINRIRVIQYGGDGNHVFWFELQGSNDGENWDPIMRAKSVPHEFDSATQVAPQVEWLKP